MLGKLWYLPNWNPESINKLKGGIPSGDAPFRESSCQEKLQHLFGQVSYQPESHVWYIYLHLVEIYGNSTFKRPVPWMLWETNPNKCCWAFSWGELSNAQLLYLSWLWVFGHCDHMWFASLMNEFTIKKSPGCHDLAWIMMFEWFDKPDGYVVRCSWKQLEAYMSKLYQYTWRIKGSCIHLSTYIIYIYH